MRDEEEESDSVKAERHAHPSSSLSEFAFINRIRQRARRHAHKLSRSYSSLLPPSSSLLQGIGDDAAIIRQRSGRETVITADLLVEDVDFRRTTTNARSLGHKALAVSLSDIAAMGARPLWAMLSLGVPDDVWRSDFIDEFYEGFFALAETCDVTLIGGDVSRTPERIAIDSIVLGEVAASGAVLRSGARPGDHIFVTGSLGGSAAGLRLLERAPSASEGDEHQDRQDEALLRLRLRHLRPAPRVKWGGLLGEERLATAMIDLSDGLSSDLAHLCHASRTGALIEASRIPLDADVVSLCGRRVLDPLMLALHGGEDFELLFTIRPRDLRRLPEMLDGVRATYIGDVTRREGRVRLVEGGRSWTLKPGGFTHF